MNKERKLIAFGEEYTVKVYKKSNGEYALECFDEEYHYWAPFSNLTRILPPAQMSALPSKEFAYIDVNQHFDIEGFIKKENLGTPAGISNRSGYVDYPIYKLNLEEIQK